MVDKAFSAQISLYILDIYLYSKKNVENIYESFEFFKFTNYYRGFIMKIVFYKYSKSKSMNKGDYYGRK